MCTIQQISDQLATVVDDSKPCYLMPVSPALPALDDSDSFLYQHGNVTSWLPDPYGVSGCRPYKRQTVKGLVETQKTLIRNIPLLKALKSIPTEKWIILFVVSETMMVSFEFQWFGFRGI